VVSEKILCAITGHGNPHFKEKMPNCINNLRLIGKTSPFPVEFIVFCYDDSCDLSFYDNIKNCKLVKEPGIVGQFIYKHLTPDFISKYSRVIIMLDDIILPDDFTLLELMRLQDQLSLDIISPSLTKDSKYSYMFMLEDEKYNSHVRVVNFLEYFFYLFKTDTVEDMNTYKKFHTLFDSETKWMWGIDYAIYNVLNLKLGIVNDLKIKHCYIGSDEGRGTNQAMDEFNRNINKYNLNEHVNKHTTLYKAPT
jgi:hypothetical protein